MKLQPISVVFTAPEENIGQINRALAAGTVPVLALSSDSTKVLAKVILRLSTIRSIRLVVQFA